MDSALLILTSLKLATAIALLAGFFIFRRTYKLLDNCLLSARVVTFESKLGLGWLDRWVTRLGSHVLKIHGFLHGSSSRSRESQLGWTLILAKESSDSGKQFLAFEHQIQRLDQTTHLTTDANILDHRGNLFKDMTLQLGARDWVRCMGIQKTLSFFDPLLAMAQQAAVSDLSCSLNKETGPLT